MQIHGRQVRIRVMIFGGLATGFAFTLLMYTSDQITEYANWSPTSRYVARCAAGLPAFLIGSRLLNRHMFVEAEKKAGSDGQ